MFLRLPILLENESLRLQHLGEEVARAFDFIQVKFSFGRQFWELNMWESELERQLKFFEQRLRMQSDELLSQQDREPVKGARMCPVAVVNSGEGDVSAVNRTYSSLHRMQVYIMCVESSEWMKFGGKAVCCFTLDTGS